MSSKDQVEVCGYSPDTKKCSRRAYPNQKELCELNPKSKRCVLKKTHTKKDVKVVAVAALEKKTKKRIIKKKIIKEKVDVGVEDIEIDAEKSEKRVGDERRPYKATPYYPDTSDPYFGRKIYEKKEFFQHQIPMRKKSQVVGDIGEGKVDGVGEGDIGEGRVDGVGEGIEGESSTVKSTEFSFSPSQKFLQTFINPLTPYMSVLVYHGTGVGKTCSAIGIAEQFRKNLPPKRKIYILLPPAIKPQFQNTILNPENIRQYVNNPGGHIPNQCTGDGYLEYFDETTLREFVNRKKVTESMKKKVYAIIRKYYHMIGYDRFASLVEYEEKKAIKNVSDVSRHPLLQKQARQRMMNNTVLIIDEAHRIRMEDGSTKKSSPVIERVVRDAVGLRLILLSATPMYNSSREIVFLLNLLRQNSGESVIKESDIFTSKGSFQEGGIERLQKASQGYISYLRGENPDHFPLRLYPDVNRDRRLLTSFPKYDLQGIDIPESDRIQHLNIVGHHMSEYHYNIYLKSINHQAIDEITKEADNGRLSSDSISEEDSLDDVNVKKSHDKGELGSLAGVFFSSRHASLCVFPTDPELTKARDIDVKYLYGISGFHRTFKTLHKAGQRRYQYRDHAKGFLAYDGLEKYSSKIKAIIEYIDKCEGIVYVYSQFITTGILLLALALEQHGYQRSEGEPLLDYPNKTKRTIKDGGGRYIFISGQKELSPDNQSAIEKAIHPDNKNGERVKVILGSPIAGEGLDLRCVREVHLLEPWFHMNLIEQVVGRGIRNKSHINLPMEKRNVTVYLHASIDSRGGSAKESIDMYMYRISERKMLQSVQIEKMIKTNAIDCQLNINGNQFPVTSQNIRTGQGVVVRNYKSGDTPYSRGCHYQKTCNYTCQGMDSGRGSGGIQGGIDENTYQMSHASLEMSEIKRSVKLYLGQHFIARVETLENLINHPERIEEDQRGQRNSILYYALQYLLDNGEVWLDKYGRKGRLVYLQGYYMFQPFEQHDPSIPLAVRNVPVSWKRDNLKIPLSFFSKKTAKKRAEVEVEEVDTIGKNIRYFYDETQVNLRKIIDREQTAYEEDSQLVPYLSRLDTDTVKRLVLTRILDNIDSSVFKKLLGMVQRNTIPESIKDMWSVAEIKDALRVMKLQTRENLPGDCKIYGFMTTLKDRSVFKVMIRDDSHKNRGKSCKNYTQTQLLSLLALANYDKGKVTDTRFEREIYRTDIPSMCMELEFILRHRGFIASRNF